MIMSRFIELKKKLGGVFGRNIEGRFLKFIWLLEKTFFKNIRYYLFRKISPLWGGIVVPIKEAIHPSVEITTSQEIIEIAKRSGIIGVFPCFCRTTMYHDPNCKAPVNTCIIMGNGKYIKELEKDNDFTHVSIEEVENAIKKADEYGLIHQLIHFPGPDFYYVICNCCDCCCAVLSTYKKFDNHIKMHGDQLFLIKPSHFIARVDETKCKGCKTCLTRCNFHAIEIQNDISITIEANCKGCGLCATGCPNDARKLFLREKKEKIS